MKVLFIALAICAVALATSVPDHTIVADKPAENKTAPVTKPTRDARYYLVAGTGRIYDSYLGSTVSDIVLSRDSYRTEYVVDAPVSRSRLVYY